MKRFSFNYTKHKIRLDRGRLWYGLLQSVMIAILVQIFQSNKLWYKITSALSVFIIIYLLGLIDDKLKLVDKEQKGYSKRNEIIMQILKEIKEIKKEINNKK